jgi:subtilisin family serine protease
VGHILVKLQPGASIQAVAADYGVTILDQVPGTALYSLSVPAGSNELTFAAQLTADPRVVYAEEDEILDAPEFHGKQIHFAFDKGPNPGGYVNQTAYQQVDMARLPAGVTGAGVVVAVLDTGAAFTHPALAGHLLPGYNVLQPNTLPWDLPDGATNVAVGHGTMIAGIIARLAPNARILPVRVMDADGVGTMLDVAKGVHYAVTQGARVLNMSFGAPKLTEAMKDALDEAKNAGVVLVAAAGNDGLNQVQYPAAGRNALAVASVESTLVKSDYSNYGSFVQVVAPGTGIRSTDWTGGYATSSGTSFAVPFVTAEVALVLSARSQLSGGACVGLIDASAVSVDGYNPAYRGLLGKGMIDIGKTVLSAR